MERDSVFVLIVADATARNGFTFGGTYLSESAAEAAFAENYGENAPEEPYIYQSVPTDEEN